MPLQATISRVKPGAIRSINCRTRITERLAPLADWLDGGEAEPAVSCSAPPASPTVGEHTSRVGRAAGSQLLLADGAPAGTSGLGDQGPIAAPEGQTVSRTLGSSSPMQRRLRPRLGVRNPTPVDL